MGSLIRALEDINVGQSVTIIDGEYAMKAFAGDIVAFDIYNHNFYPDLSFKQICNVVAMVFKIYTPWHTGGRVTYDTHAHIEMIAISNIKKDSFVVIEENGIREQKHWDDIVNAVAESTGLDRSKVANVLLNVEKKGWAIQRRIQFD